MRDPTVKFLSHLHTLVLGASRGKFGTRLANNDMLLLTTIGRSTGTTHTVPLLYLTDRHALIVIASYGGRPKHPDWYRNLLVNDRATAQVGGETRTVQSETLSTEERSEWWPRIVEAYADYATYQSRTERLIPVVRLRSPGG
jgi:deazaflavin-dependent oxidoreductase (nitroreductase family)